MASPLNAAMRTLLVGTASSSWREWLREHREDADLMLLSPQDAAFGFPARYALLREQKVLDSRFVGSLDPLRSPHMTVSATARFSRCAQNPMLLLGDLGRSALARQTMQGVLEAFAPERVLTPIGGHPWVRGAETELATAPPPAVASAQRRAYWIDLLERSHVHDLPSSGLRFEGTRLGTGEEVQVKGAIHAERIGSTLYAILEEEFDERAVSLALDQTGTRRAHLVGPETFRGLLCALVRENGEEAGIGIIERFDLANGSITVRSPAVPPMRISTLRIGALRLDGEGNEVGEIRPWGV